MALREGLLPGSLLASRLAVLVLDEADLLLSYGYEEDLQLLAPQVGRVNAGGLTHTKHKALWTRKLRLRAEDSYGRIARFVSRRGGGRTTE